MTDRPLVLVLGGTGFIGSHVVERLLADDYRVRVFSRGSHALTPFIAGVDYRVGDFVEGQGLREALAEVHIVVHCISTTIPKASNAVMEYDIASNLLGTVRLLNLCVETGVKRVVFISSGGTVYGPQPAGQRISESTPTHPIVSHGIIKLAIEEYLAVFERTHGLEYVVLRGGNVYGPRQNPNGTQGFINVLLGRVARGIPVEIYGNGLGLKDYLYVADFAEACSRAVFYPDANRQVYNVGSGIGVSIQQIIQEAQQVTGSPVLLKYHPALPNDVGFVLDIHKAYDGLAWTPHWNLTDGISETWRWIQSNLNSVDIEMKLINEG